MNLYSIAWEVMGGDEYTTLVATRHMDEQKARKFIIKTMRKEDKFFEDVEIVDVDFEEQLEAKALNGQIYDIRLIRKGLHGFLDRINFKGK